MSTIKARPILFSGAMVRALLAGTKTQTRRIMKPQPRSNGMVDVDGELTCRNDFLPPDAMLWERGSVIGYDAETLCPYGSPGERLWVRESLKVSNGSEDGVPFVRVRYMADERGVSLVGTKWTPSIHMRRFQSRITLEITEVRVQRLQEISEADAMAEGVDLSDEPETDAIAIGRYRHLWDEINGAGAWDANPWVWCVSFKRVSA